MLEKHHGADQNSESFISVAEMGVRKSLKVYTSQPPTASIVAQNN